jgi:hypothetical protein
VGAKVKGFEMTKSKGVGRGGARPGSGRKPKAITPRVEALKDALAALECGRSNFGDADRRFVRAMIALGAPNNATAAVFGISEAELLAKFPYELETRAGDLNLAKASVSSVRAPRPPLSSTFAYRESTRPEGLTSPLPGCTQT